ncbi:unnamed protein product [Cuscuta epithymum]|uniref:Uncharacterized protein n=1 Tax=Cuscuta epithymum TaxID=186058 RepID=A0AAV0DFN1_9ASTE|nr:unnamed protein product [Cuscuta epithymum]
MPKLLLHHLMNGLPNAVILLYDDRLHHRLVIIIRIGSSSSPSAHHHRPPGLGVMLYLKTGLPSAKCLELATELAIPFRDSNRRLYMTIGFIIASSSLSGSAHHHRHPLITTAPPPPPPGLGVMLYLKTGLPSAKCLELATELAIPFRDSNRRLYMTIGFIIASSSLSGSAHHHRHPLITTGPPGLGMMLYLKTGLPSAKCLELATGLAIPLLDGDCHFYTTIGFIIASSSLSGSAPHRHPHITTGLPALA